MLIYIFKEFIKYIGNSCMYFRYGLISIYCFDVVVSVCNFKIMFLSVFKKV